MPFFNNENVYFTYDGGSYNGTLVATIHSPDVGVTYRFSCGDANSTPVQAAAVTDPLVLTISDIGDPNPSYTFTSRVWRLDNNQDVAIDVFEIGSTSAYRFGATWEYDGTRTVVVHFYGVGGVNYRMTTSDENGSLGLGDVVGANATTSISVTASGDYTNGFIGKLYTTDASAEDFAAHIFYQAVAIGISPDNDDYVAPEVIPPAGGVISGDTLNATTEGGEVYLLTQNFIVAPQSLWYTLTPVTADLFYHFTMTNVVATGWDPVYAHVNGFLGPNEANVSLWPGPITYVFALSANAGDPPDTRGLMTAAGETYRLSLQSNAQYHDLFNQGTGSFDITITTTDVSSYPAGTLVDRSFTFNGDTSGDTTDAIGYDIEDYGTPHLYYSFVAPTTTTVTLLCVGGGGFLPYVEVLDDSLWANPTDYGELAWVDQLGDGTTSPPSISLSLTAGRTYYLTVADWNFTTPGSFQLTIPDFVSVYQEEASSVTNRTAILSALVNPRGVSSTAHFEYGLDTSYGTSTTPQGIGSGSAFLAVQDSIADLTPGRVYYFRGVVSP